MTFLGELSALLTAFLWSSGSIIFAATTIFGISIVVLERRTDSYAMLGAIGQGTGLYQL